MAGRGVASQGTTLFALIEFPTSHFPAPSHHLPGELEAQSTVPLWPPTQPQNIGTLPRPSTILNLMWACRPRWEMRSYETDISPPAGGRRAFRSTNSEDEPTPTLRTEARRTWGSGLKMETCNGWFCSSVLGNMKEGGKEWELWSWDSGSE
ncbi:hypothetical protein P170DRAFT_478540 [Aspergillus steynii IBT 23096]|uniref:Uncharacterized protein n=1 Tax=Aspergillus steynii IBT 23096 TaxID=1392250 RepID=A0A2I2FYF1_9EURO|nr:uncharacterized protein P170DRAFT_478540 [Aspergillus steynii IBT 23096]PLB45586.1 hypothetical protein P170DRAFT_478540 [Aspergillus steynii IBT 23096]